MHSVVTPEKFPVLILTALALAAASGCGTPKQKEARFLVNGKRQLLRQDYARAILEFRNAIQVMPRDAEAYYQLGLADLAGGNPVGAVAALRKATELNPAHAEAQVKLADMMALSGVQAVVRDGEKRMHDVLRASPGNVGALDALALSEFQLGKWQDARAHLEEALEKFPQSVASAVALARLDLAKRDLKAAEQVLKQVIEAVPQSPEARAALGHICMLAGQWAEAEGKFRAALEIDPKFAPGLLGLAAAQIRSGRTDQAEQTYRMLSALPDEKRYRGLYGSYLFQEGKRDAAIREFERLARLDRGDRQTRTFLVAAYVLTNRTQDAEKILTAALRDDPKDSDALLQRSQILLRAGKLKEAESDIIQVLHLQPDSARGHYLLARIFREREDPLRERQELSEVLRFDPALLPARLELARCLIEAGSAQAALDILNAAPEQKGVLALVIERNWALLALNDDAEAGKWLKQGLAVARLPDLLVQDVVLKLRQGDYGGARASAGEVLQQNPEDLRALRLIAASYIAQKQPAAAVRALQDQAARHPRSAAIQQFVGEWLLASGEAAQARAAFTAAHSADPNSPGVKMAMARLDITQGRLDEAREILTAILSSGGPNPEAHLWLGTVEVKGGHYAAAIEQFREVLKAEDNNVVALNNLAYLLANFARQPDEALAFAQKACELAPDNTDAEGTLAWVLYRKGLYASALEYLQKAVEKDGKSSTENAAIRKYHLGMTYLKLGDRNRGLNALHAALEIDASLPGKETAN